MKLCLVHSGIHCSRGERGRTGSMHSAPDPPLASSVWALPERQATGFECWQNICFRRGDGGQTHLWGGVFVCVCVCVCGGGGVWGGKKVEKSKSNRR